MTQQIMRRHSDSEADDRPAGAPYACPFWLVNLAQAIHPMSSQEEFVPIKIMTTLALVALMTTASAQTSQEREAFLVAAGEGYAHVPPDFAEFSAEVSSRADSLEAATRDHTERTA